MASETAFQSGMQLAENALAHQQARREALTDEERRLRVSDLFTKRDALINSITTLGTVAPERGRLMSALTDIESDLAALYHPVHSGALQRDRHFLRGLFTRQEQVPVNVNYDPVTTAPVTVTMANGEKVTLPATPSYASRAGGKTTMEPGTGEETVSLPSAPITIPGSTFNVRPAPEIMTPPQRERMAARDAARQAAKLDIEAGPLTPEREAQGQSAKSLAYVTQAVKDFRTMKPDATPQERAQFFNDLIAKQYGFPQSRPTWKEFTGPNGEKEWFDVTRPEGVPPGWTATGTESADVRKRADFDAYRKQHPEYSGSYEQWITEQSQLGRRAVPTNRDDRFIDIEQRRALGEPISADDQAYAAAWNLYVNKRVIAPGVARAAAFANDRYVQVVDPNDPEKVVFMRAGDAARAGVGTPASIGFKTDAAVTKFMTAGPGAQNIGYFNTATDHLKLLGETADALNNGDIQAANRIGNYLGVQFGDDAVTNFNTVKSAVAGELSKTFKGTGATDQEISEINQTINSAMSPDQLHGAINYYTRLMGGKMNALRAQYEAGKGGRPAFPAAQGSSAAPGAGATKGARSVSQAMEYWRSHPQQSQKVFGTLAPTEQQVINDIQSKGYNPVRP